MQRVSSNNEATYMNSSDEYVSSSLDLDSKETQMDETPHTAPGEYSGSRPLLHERRDHFRNKPIAESVHWILKYGEHMVQLFLKASVAVQHTAVKAEIEFHACD